MADVDLKTLSPDTSLPTDGFLFGADSQSAASPSVYSTQTVATTLLGSTALTGATVTTSQPVLDLSQTWNAGAVTFTGLKFNATDTASAAGSLLLDLQVGGVSRISVRKDGDTTFADGTGRNFIIRPSDAINQTNVEVAANMTFNAGATGVWGYGSEGLRIGSGRTIAFGTHTGSTGDLILSRAAAATLQLGAADAAAPVPQFLQPQGVVAGTLNTAGANFTIRGSDSTGNAAGGSIIFQVAPAGSSGTAQNAYATALTITSRSVLEFTPSSSIATSGNGIGSLNSVDLSVFIQGTRAFAFSNGLLYFLNNATQGIAFNLDTYIYRDAANTLALRNGALAQRFNSYRSFTDASNYQRLSLAWNTSTALVMNEGAGTGADGSVTFNDAALATDATRGFIMVPSCAGAPTGTPADIPTGQIPLVWDSTNLKLYVYTGGAWKSSAAFT